MSFEFPIRSTLGYGAILVGVGMQWGAVGLVIAGVLYVILDAIRV